MPELLHLDTVFLYAAFDGAGPSFELISQIPRIDYGSIRVDTIQLDGREEGSQFLSDLSVRSIHTDPSLPALHPHLALQLGRDSLHWQFGLEADSLGQLFDLQG